MHNRVNQKPPNRILRTEKPKKEMGKVIIDTDAGVDDSIGILMALLDEETEVIGITCLSGNAPLNLVVPNVLSCLYTVWKHYSEEVSGKMRDEARAKYISNIKIYPGATKPLLCGPTMSVEWHEKDGLGDALSTEERTQHLKFAELFDVVKTRSFGNSAVNFLVETFMTSEDLPKLVVLGPMTNLALAMHMEPRLLDRKFKVVAMAGSLDFIGNSTEVAEFNIYEDPEAAKICFDGFDVDIVDWKATKENGISYTTWENIFQPHPNSFANRITNKLVMKSKAMYATYPLPDPLAVLVALRPEAAIEAVDTNVKVIVHGECRGMTLVDRRPLGPPKNQCVHKFIKKLDEKLFISFIEKVAPLV
eukprot:augustus_masked-scaffold_43-processed-gene-1.15-mRNA-1 protein AED:1.00 eAED:1.00 QI:0/-1/0/0/-1/1/1/0/361